MRLDWKEFGADVRRKRTAQEETVRQAAARLDIPSATFSRADRGLPINAVHFVCICFDFLKQSPKVYVRRRHG